jgi:hypothetical protein
MSIQFTNQNGITYYLCRGTTKTGKPRYYFAREPKGESVAQIPAGYRITESVNGVVSLSKDVPALVLPTELLAVQSAMRKHPHSDLYRVAVKRNRIEVYERDGPVADDILEAFQSAGLFNSGMRDKIETQLAQGAHFSPVVLFTLIDSQTRMYRLDRMGYTGMGGWRYLYPDDRIEEQLERIIPRLGTESYFDIY